EIEVWVDGEFADKSTASEPRTRGEGHLFRSRLPERFLDGRPHEIVVMLPNHHQIVGAVAVITPFSLTPFDSLQKYAGNAYLKGYLSPVGAQRYESLRKNLEHLQR